VSITTCVDGKDCNNPIIAGNIFAAGWFQTIFWMRGRRMRAMVILSIRNPNRLVIAPI
jgi:hypothetical protein